MTLYEQPDAIVNVIEVDHSPLWLNTFDKSLSIIDFLKDVVLSKRSRNIEIYYRLDGTIYIYKIEKFLEDKKKFLKDKIFDYQMNRHKLTTAKILYFSISNLSD